ncbi:MAG: hypothetical protein ACE5KE_10850 [Methanosarcinales archaeon]
MGLYTADSVAILAYLADKLPSDSKDIFEDAENGIVEIQVPAICVGEVIYAITKKRKVFGAIVPNEKISVLFDVLESQDFARVSELQSIVEL